MAGVDMMGSSWRRAISDLRYWGAAACIAGLASGCSSVPVEDRDRVRDELDIAAQESLQRFIEEDAAIAKELAAAPGYMVCNATTLMVAALGSASSACVLYDQQRRTRTYLDGTSLNVGVGLGSVEAEYLAIVKTEDMLDQLQRGRWVFQPSLGGALGDASSAYILADGDLEVLARSESGATAVAGVGITHLNVNQELTDTGLATISFPTLGASSPSRQTEAAPRKWPHRLPFLAQDVVDLGFNLPNPYGIGITIADVDQEMTLTDLMVGFNGTEPKPYEFVAFNDTATELRTTQIKVDAWLFPFMNVFAMFGQVDGDIQMNVLVDGDKLLSQAGKDCSKVIKPVSCLVLEGRNVTLPIRTGVSPITYGAGTVLAGGWHDWFVALPINITYSEPNNAVANGRSFTVTPRGGHAFQLNRLGRLSLFAGGNYLDSRNTVNGTLIVPKTDIQLEYRIKQRNKDRWALVTGFNWDVSPRLSWTAEYNGFIGTRESFISSLVVRF